MRYSKPSGYQTLFLVNGLIGRSYKAWNGFVSGDTNYSSANYSFQIADLTSSGTTPADLSQITVPDGPNNAPGTPTRTFTFTYGGSPGTGIIPLVGGGGTAAQAIIAAVTAMSAQLTQWSVSSPSALVLRLTSRLPGMNTAPALVGVTDLTLTRTLSTLGAVVPGRFGKQYCFLPVGT